MIMLSSTDATRGLFHGSFQIQSNHPVAPRMRPATSSEAVTVNAVTKLGNRMAKVAMVCAIFQPAAIPGSMNWWWKPTGVDRMMNSANTIRASGSLNNLPPASRGRTVYHTTYAGSSQK